MIDLIIRVIDAAKSKGLIYLQLKKKKACLMLNINPRKYFYNLLQKLFT
jgi:hypothetical protein